MRRHLEPRLLSLQARSKLRSNTWRRPKEEEPESTARAHCRQERDEVDAGYRSADPAAVAPGSPDHACAVRQAQVGGFQDPGKVGVSARPHHEFRIDRGDQVVAAGIDKLLDTAEGTRHVDAVDPDPQDPNFSAYFGRSAAGLFIGGSSMPTVSKFSAVTMVCGMGVPRLAANSGSASPPPTRTRVHV